MSFAHQSITTCSSSVHAGLLSHCLTRGQRFTSDEMLRDEVGTNVESGVRNARGIQVAENALQAASSREVCKEVGVLPVGNSYPHIGINVAGHATLSHCGPRTWQDHLLEVIRDRVEVFGLLRRIRCVLVPSILLNAVLEGRASPLTHMAEHLRDSLVGPEIRLDVPAGTHSSRRFDQWPDNLLCGTCKIRVRAFQLDPSGK